MAYMKDSTGRRLDTFKVADGNGLTAIHPSRVLTPVTDHVGVPALDGNLASGSSIFGAYRLQHKITAANGFNVITAQFVNWYAMGFNGETDGPNDITVSAAWETGDGTRYPMTFSGAKKRTLKPGETVWSDPMALPHKGAADTYDYIWSRTQVDVATLGQKWPFTTNASNSARPGEGFSQGSSYVTDYTMNGTIGTADSAVYGPVAILGDAVNTKPLAALVGDSIMAGAGDNTAVGAGFPSHGFGARAFLAAKIPFIKVANPGDRVSRWSQPAYSYRRYTWLPGVKNVIHEYGINDIEGGAATQDTVQTNLVKSWKMIAAMGCNIWQTTLTPFTTTTDNWATEANQTVSTKQAVRIAVNAWIRDGAPLDPATKLYVAAGTSGALRAGQAGHPLKGYLEIADAVESARDSGKWKTTGTAFGYVTDGIHPNGRGHDAMAAVITAALPAMGY